MFLLNSLYPPRPLRKQYPGIPGVVVYRHAWEASQLVWKYYASSADKARTKHASIFEYSTFRSKVLETARERGLLSGVGLGRNGRTLRNNLFSSRDLIFLRIVLSRDRASFFFSKRAKWTCILHRAVHYSAFHHRYTADIRVRIPREVFESGAGM